MQHTIIMVTFPDPVPTTGSNATDLRRAFFKNNAINFGNATIGSVTIEDDDDRFELVRDTITPKEAGQRLIEDTLIGQGKPPVLAGTQLEPYPGSVITDSLGNSFYAFFAATPAAVEIGSRHSVLIIPIAKADSTGTLQWPTFNPSLTFRYTSSTAFGTNNPGAPYPPVKSPPCFTPGTWIATPTGPRLVEDLRAGDMVHTRDHGAQPIRWIGSVALSPSRLDLQPNLRPIRIAAGALGPSLPARDLVVSPQHRVLVSSRIAERMFGCVEVLVAAKHLIGLPGVEVLRPEATLTYIHMLFDRHDLVLSNGTWTESLLPRDRAIAGLATAAQREIRQLFPGLTDPEPARKILTGKEGRALLGRHVKNRKVLATL